MLVIISPKEAVFAAEFHNDPVSSACNYSLRLSS